MADLLLWLCDEAFGNRHDTLSNSIAQSGRVESIVVLHHHAPRLNLDVNLKLGHIQFQQFLVDGLTVDHILREHAHLISVGDSGHEAKVGSDTGEGIVLMAQCLVEGLAHLFQVFAHRHIADVQTEGEGVDEHTHRIGNPQIRASAADGAEIHFAVVGVTRDDIARGSEEEVSRCNFLLTAEGGSLDIIGRADSLADKALLVSLGQVGRNLARAFTSLQFLGEELLGGLEGVSLLSLLLVADEIEIGIVLFLDGGTVERATYLTNQQIGRTTVEHEVMNIQKQMGSSFRLYDLETVERCFIQVERAHELILIGRQRLIAHLRDGYLDRQTVG